MKFAHISPTARLSELCHYQKIHLLLADQLMNDIEYFRWYAAQKTKDIIYIMDNSGFERYQAGAEMLSGEKLIELANSISADYVVLPDHPGFHSSRTIKDAQKYGIQIKQAGIKTFFVPQSQVGDIEDYVAGFAWAASSPLIDYIGVSILAVPNAYGVYTNKIQRYSSRHRMMKELDRRGILQLAYSNKKKIHFLGMLDGPREIELVSDPNILIDSWDSSAAIWAGLNGVVFDNTPTGLKDGKFELPVDFTVDNRENIQLAKYNIGYIDKLVEQYNKDIGIV